MKLLVKRNRRQTESLSQPGSSITHRESKGSRYFPRDPKLTAIMTITPKTQHQYIVTMLVIRSNFPDLHSSSLWKLYAIAPNFQYNSGGCFRQNHKIYNLQSRNLAYFSPDKLNSTFQKINLNKVITNLISKIKQSMNFTAFSMHSKCIRNARYITVGMFWLYMDLVLYQESVK